MLLGNLVQGVSLGNDGGKVGVSTVLDVRPTESPKLGTRLDVPLDEVDVVVVIDGYVDDSDTPPDALRVQSSFAGGDPIAHLLNPATGLDAHRPTP